ncbi:hypothetical protein ACIQZB_43595 [Streptomyces sp. NPDC097727]|uniref:hypothetical protein n=1 Tax=Streptomyces sp. NPDC097727 TaxID=3366092 RepID=UPI0038242B11
MAVYTLTPTTIGATFTGWNLTGAATAFHSTFDSDINRNVEQAMDWAEQIIGTRQNWWHIRENGRDRWEAVTTR